MLNHLGFCDSSLPLFAAVFPIQGRTTCAVPCFLRNMPGRRFLCEQSISSFFLKNLACSHVRTPYQKKMEMQSALAGKSRAGLQNGNVFRQLFLEKENRRRRACRRHEKGPPEAGPCSRGLSCPDWRGWDHPAGLPGTCPGVPSDPARQCRRAHTRDIRCRRG